MDRLHAAIVPEGRRARPRALWARPPRFLCARRCAQGARRAAEDPGRGLPARRLDGLNMVVPYGDPTTTPPAAASRSRPAPGAADAAVDLDGFFGLHPALAPLCRSGTRAARRRPRVRLARPHALALRRPGLHGDRHARREVHGGRLAQARAGRHARTGRPRPFRAVALTPPCRASCAATGRGGHDAASPTSTCSEAAAQTAGGLAAQQGLRGALRAERARPPPRHRPRDLRGHRVPQGGRRRSATRRPPARSTRAAARRQPAADRAAHQGRRRARGRLRRDRRLGHPRGAGREHGQLALRLNDSARRSPRSTATWATGCATSSC